MKAKKLRPASKDRVLVVDDAPDTLEVIRRNLESRGLQVVTAPGVAEAARILKAAPADLVITDYKMPKASGLDLIRHVRENFKDTAVLMITGYATIDGAVEAIMSGAEDYITKPFTDEELFLAVEKSLSKLRFRQGGRKAGLLALRSSGGLIGESAAMKRIYNDIAKVAASSATLLITGESGTGKELVARAIHYNGARVSAPFVPVNCGGIPAGLLDSELFGHMRGAFTGASESRAGFFQTADGGTIFLDEISETGLDMQVKLLRVLQDKNVYMVGSRRGQKVNVRIIAATNKDLPALVEKGGFREDLFYRLNVVTITLPPLRMRGDDIPLLTHHFLERFAKEIGRPTPQISDNVLKVLRKYHWPGNVRELENVLHRLMVMMEGDFIDVPDLPSLMRFSALRENEPLRKLTEVESEHIRAVLAGANGNKSRAAEILGIDRKTLREKLKKYSIKSPA